MPGVHLIRWMEHGRRILRLPGTFDGDAAGDLLRQIRMERERDVVIDVALVRELDEAGVATLARLAGRSGARSIVLRGLSRHQHRILRHLGASLSELGAGGGA